MAEYLPNKPQLALNNENLNKVLADLEGLPGGANLNIATQDGVLIGTLTKDTDGFYKMQPAEDPWAEIDAQAGLIEEAIKALENKFIEAGVKGIDYGTITQSKEQPTLTAEHSLGVVPKFAVLVPYDVIIERYATNFWIAAFGAKDAYPNLYNAGWDCNLSGYLHVQNLETETSKPSATNKKVFFKSGATQHFAPGTYYWFAVAGG